MWPAIIAAGASIIGGALSSSGAKDASKEAAAASDKEIAYNRETRDLILAQQKPYVDAGYTALDALMSMTGLGSGKALAAGRGPSDSMRGVPDATERRRLGQRFSGARDSGGTGSAYRDYATSGMYRPVTGGQDWGGLQHYPGDGGYLEDVPWEGEEIVPSYRGGPTSKRAMYNINELGPESVYTAGRVTRGINPTTIDGQTGYVQPNIKSRYTGGAIRNDELDTMGGKTTPPWMQGQGGGSPSTGGAKPPYAPPPNVPGNTAGSTAINPATGYPNENPGGQEGGYSFMTDPGYQFRFSEGMRALDRGAAARGGLLSGGYGRKAMRYGQDYASGEYTNVYNRIANIAGLGQTANTTSSNAALYTGQNMGTAAAQGGYARASGYAASGNAWANAANDVASLPWDDYFGDD